jgi:hypothetical protein
VATEGRNYTVPALVHLLGIALGLYLGFLAMEAISPDLPDAGVDPGVSSSSRPAAVLGDDPDSLFRAVNLGPALEQLDEQLAAGDGIVSLHITPGSVDAETGSADGVFQPDEVPVDVPALIGIEINQERGGVTLADVSYMDLVATAKGPRWYVQLDVSRDIGPPPWTYGAPIEGEPLTLGPEPSKPVSG